MSAVDGFDDMGTGLDMLDLALAMVGLGLECSFVTSEAELAANVRLGVAPVDDEVARIRETLTQTWPRCGGHTPSAAEDWRHEGFHDEMVVEWLEAGVFTVGGADELLAHGLLPEDVRREHADGVTLGLAYARGELSIAEVQRIVLGGEVDRT